VSTSNGTSSPTTTITNSRIVPTPARSPDGSP
jgi:hypothetical protein